MRVRTRVAGIPFAVALLAPLTLQPAPATAHGRHVAHVTHARGGADFNGDGYTDLAVGVPNENVRTGYPWGAVNVIYGSATGLTDAGNQSIAAYELTDPIPAEEFGRAVAAGDFDGDGFSDLAVGSPGDNASGGGWDGTVRVFYGSADGLTRQRDQLWAQGIGGLPDAMEGGDFFGQALGAGDFDGDGQDVLADEDDAEGGRDSNGAVQVIYGSATGLSARGNQLWSQDSLGVADEPEYEDEFGSSLAVGDFGGSAEDDLAIGVPGEGTTTPPLNEGAVQVLYGSPRQGLTAAGAELWTQDSRYVRDEAEQGDHFGSALAATDLGRGHRDDLVIGVPGEDVDPATYSDDNEGAVAVLYGTRGGLSAAGNQFWTEESPGITGSAEYADAFGVSLATGDFGRGPAGDLAAGGRSGEVHVLFGGARGLSHRGDQEWTAENTGTARPGEASRSFGRVLAAGRFSKSRLSRLVIGNPGVGFVDNFNAVGEVVVLPGSARGLTTDGLQVWSQDSPGIADQREYDDGFGSSLTSGR
jgi:hypothetical protein